MTKLFRGGGTKADTISAVPQAIDTMLKENYKKMATIKNLNVELLENKENVIKLNNLNFKPSRFFITLHGLDFNDIDSYETVDSLKGEKITTNVGVVVDIKSYNIKYEHSTKSLKIKPEKIAWLFTIVEILAIE